MAGKCHVGCLTLKVLVVLHMLKSYYIFAHTKCRWSEGPRFSLPRFLLDVLHPYLIREVSAVVCAEGVGILLHGAHAMSNTLSAPAMNTLGSAITSVL